MDASQLETIPLFADLTLDQRASLAGVCDTLEADVAALVRDTISARVGADASS